MERVEAELIGDERTMLRQFLDYQRQTFLLKIDGLDSAQLVRQIPSSSLTLAGLAKHLALVEDSWMQERFLGIDNLEPWSSAPFADDPDWEFHSAVADNPDDLIDLYRTACERSRRAEANAQSLDVLSAVPDARTGSKFSLRWILLHLVEETSRHNGHADLLREAVDGVTGE